MKLLPFHQLAHDLRTPLGVIVAYADLLAQEKNGTLNPKQTRYVTNIKAAASALTELLANAERSHADSASAPGEQD